MKSFISLVLLWAISLSLIAQAPQGINYQTVVRNTTGNVLTNTNVGIKINIRSTSVSGTIVYAETHAVSTNQFGLVNFVIGQGTVVSGTFANINWGSGTYFAETFIDPSGGTAYVSVGAQQLMSVPYALYANKAENGSSWRDTSYLDFATLRPTVFSTKIATISVDTFKNGVQIKDGGIEIWTSNLINPLIYGPPQIDFKTDFNKDADMRIAYVGTSTGVDDRLTFSSLDNSLSTPTWKWDKFVFSNKGNFGVNNTGAGFIPKSRIHVNDGDVYVDNSTKGIILKSPNGNCWRVTIDNSGNLVRTSITCP